MGKINVLPFAVANLIAAGEVVDRPASVIKELLENAIDAGATRITVEIQHGGITFMRVADDGAGIAKEDLPVAIRRHATSKIKNAADLDGITTLGFRGEALAAIASVSDLRIISRTADVEYGAVLEAHGGEIAGVSEQGAPVGTTVIVENLFANVPARRKFLKKDVAETVAVGTYVEKIALSHPDIAVRLITDGNMKLDTAGDGDLRAAMYAVFGRDFASRMIEVKGDEGSVTVSGYVGRPDNARPKRNYENFFINGRYTNCRTAAAALEQAYTSYIAPEKFPCCVLNIKINPVAVDVNVHPAKLEVKFSNERPVFETVYYAVRSALETSEARPDLELKRTLPDAAHAFVPVEEGRGVSLAAAQLKIDDTPTVSVPPLSQKHADPAFSRMSAAEYAARYTAPQKTDTRAVPQRPETRAAAPSAYRPRGEAPLPAGEEIPFPVRLPREVTEPAQAPSDNIVAPASERNVTERTSVPETLQPPAAETSPLPAYRIIGEAFHTYVLVEYGEKLLLIDKHAAHERVLFERLKENMKRREETSQMLMIPLSVPLSAGDLETLQAYRAEVEAIGFGFTVSAHEAEISEIPTGIATEEAAELLMTIAERLTSGTGDAALTREIVFEKALYQGACKAAIKAGREYPPEYVEWLVAQLMALPDITVCPHGRPVAMVLSRASLNRQFGRT